MTNIVIKEHLTEDKLDGLKKLLSTREDIISGLKWAQNNSVNISTSMFVGRNERLTLKAKNNPNHITHNTALINASLRHMQAVVLRIDAALKEAGFDVTVLPQPDITEMLA